MYHICAKIREPVLTTTDSLCSPQNIREHRSGIFTTTWLPCASQNIREQTQSKVDDEIRTPDCSMFDVFFISKYALLNQSLLGARGVRSFTTSSLEPHRNKFISGHSDLSSTLYSFLRLDRVWRRWVGPFLPSYSLVLRTRITKFGPRTKAVHLVWEVCDTWRRRCD